MAEINWTAEAERWLRDIHDYIAEDNPEAASRVVEGIYEKVQLLRQFPELGHRYERLPHQHIRILLYGHHRIAYLIKPDGNIAILGGVTAPLISIVTSFNTPPNHGLQADGGPAVVCGAVAQAEVGGGAAPAADP